MCVCVCVRACVRVCVIPRDKMNALVWSFKKKKKRVEVISIREIIVDKMSQTNQYQFKKQTNKTFKRIARYISHKKL